MISSRSRPLLLVVALLLSASAARAHDPGLSSAILRLGADAARVSMRLTDADLAALEGQPALVSISVDGARIAELDRSLRATGEGHGQIEVRFPPVRGAKLRVELPVLATLPFGHKQALRVETDGGRVLANRLLDASGPALELGIANASPSTFATLRAWGAIGTLHIATGWDHLLFLLALVIVRPRAAHLARVVTGFTLGHSVTLLGGTLGWLSLPGAVVEPAIAASIVAVAARNLIGGSEHDRIGLAAGFGLIHGLGFAGFLGELGVGASGAELVAPLAGFTLGVEAGQLALAALALPVLAAVSRWRGSEPIVVRAGSVAVGAAGLVWLVERTLLA